MFVPIEADHMVGCGSCGVPGPFRECRIVTTQQLPRCAVAAFCRATSGSRKRRTEAFDGGWFRTGDLFRQDESGWYYIVGRLKDMIRRSSENIPAREVESVLRGLPEIADAAVVPVPDELRKEEVKAYVILQPGLTRAQVPPERIIEHARRYLAPFKVPRYLEYREEFPRTPSGKVRKQVLTGEKADLRVQSWDRVDQLWR